MKRIVNQIFFPTSLQELFNTLDRFSSANIFAGGAYQIRRQHNRALLLPEIIINAGHIAELHVIARTERYIDIGSMVTLNQIFRLGKILPDAIRQTLAFLYSGILRNAALIGDIICQTRGYEPLAAALIALGVRCELRLNTQSRWISINSLTGTDKMSVFYPHEILYRIRIPLEQWDFTLCRYFDAVASGKGESGVIVFLARIQNNILSDVRVVFSGSVILRNRNCETSLIGQKLPLSKKNAADFTNLWKSYLLENSPDFLRDRILLFIESAILQFAD
ncbi:MAG: FAD binding domain-containing protein [Spirochaetaceae bacterium]|nr:FAD binding domain-containing protein [Spirochaetaceae bacterium]